MKREKRIYYFLIYYILIKSMKIEYTYFSEFLAALKLSIKGEANVSWERRRVVKDSQGHSHTQVHHFRANEQYFNLTYYLLGNTAGNTRLIY